SISRGSVVVLATEGGQAAPRGAGAAPEAAAESALFARATAAYPPRTLDDLGTPGRGFEAARTSLERLLREHPDGEHSTAAEYRLGLLQMDPANPRADLDASRASFERLAHPAPRAPAAPPAPHARGGRLPFLGPSSAPG